MVPTETTELYLYIWRWRSRISAEAKINMAEQATYCHEVFTIELNITGGYLWREIWIHSHPAFSRTTIQKQFDLRENQQY